MLLFRNEKWYGFSIKIFSVLEESCFVVKTLYQKRLNALSFHLTLHYEILKRRKLHGRI